MVYSNTRNYTKTDIATVSLRESGQDAGLDDLLNALARALMARVSDVELQRLPDYDASAEDLPMQMVYRREEAFVDSDEAK